MIHVIKRDGTIADFDKEKIVKFSKHYMGKCDGNSTQRLFDMIINDFN